jgi:hypothetical protein
MLQESVQNYTQVMLMFFFPATVVSWHVLVMLMFACKLQRISTNNDLFFLMTDNHRRVDTDVIGKSADRFTKAGLIMNWTG